ncbi:MAG: MaoC family dehydratase [Rhizobiales bacterium]|nr:MaoC family dehydratase [Hyphomicrobiales bacterium]OJY44460.1 MAG: dehydratase [Rhizobiales bacterium 64-17]
MKFFDDLRVGDRFEVGQFHFTAENIKSFATRFDPQPFHLDEAAAAKSHFGALCASGWQAAVVWMPMMVAYRKRMADEMRARGETPAVTGPAPGIRNLKWLKPVYAGDTVTYATEITAMRASASRPDWGLATLLTTGDNQTGVRVISFDSISFVSRRV